MMIIQHNKNWYQLAAKIKQQAVQEQEVSSNLTNKIDNLIFTLGGRNSDN